MRYFKSRLPKVAGATQRASRGSLTASRLEISLGHANLDSMHFQPAIPTRGSMGRRRPEWIHEVKYDGFRLMVHHDGDRVRPLSATGNWTRRYSWIAEAALKNRIKHLVSSMMKPLSSGSIVNQHERERTI
jgi:ATP-dependent DNA ligase